MTKLFRKILAGASGRNFRYFNAPLGYASEAKTTLQQIGLEGAIPWGLFLFRKSVESLVNSRIGLVSRSDYFSRALFSYLHMGKALYLSILQSALIISETLTISIEMWYNRYIFGGKG